MIEIILLFACLYASGRVVKKFENQDKKENNV